MKEGRKREGRREGRKEERKEGRNEGRYHLHEYITRCEIVHFMTECMEFTKDLCKSFLAYIRT